MSLSPTEKPAFKAPWRIGVDVGGTFTDIVMVDRTGAIQVGKVPSTPRDPSDGVIDAIETAASQLAIPVQELLTGCHHFMHASTVATNIVIDGRGSRVGMLVTGGFRDSIEIRRGIRHNAWDHRTPFPPALVPRYLRLPVAGRIDRNGQEIDPLSESDIRAAVELFRAEGVTSIAICLFNSFLSDTHEQQAAAIIRNEMPDAWVTLSSAVSPTIGEYERSSTAVLNAYVAPTIVSYMRRLAEKLAERGLKSPFNVVQNNAGALTVDHLQHRAVALLLSGPAAGIGALGLYSAALGEPNLLSMEIGGTSCDVTLLSGGHADVASEFELGGYHVAMPSIDIHSVGAGGGTVAGVDRAGLLFVGPRGAGAHPGPAAYGLGGVEPTVTDAQLVLGRLVPGPLAGGGRTLDLELAKRAIEARVAGPLGLSLEAAATGVLRIVDQQLFHAVQKLSAERGYDPRKFILVAAGGAGPMHGSSVGRKLNSPAVYVPRLAGTFCALGMLNIPVKHEFARVHLGKLDATSCDALRPVFQQLGAQANARLVADGFSGENAQVMRELDLRHRGQIGTLRVAISDDDETDWRKIREKFLVAYQRSYGHRDTTSEVEIAGIRVVGLGLFPAFRLGTSDESAGMPPVFAERQVYFDEAGGWTTAKIYQGRDLRPGATVIGPAIVHETTTSLIVGPGDLCSVDTLGNFLIRFDTGKAA
jgi:N-methylhydantoinase A